MGKDDVKIDTKKLKRLRKFLEEYSKNIIFDIAFILVGIFTVIAIVQNGGMDKHAYIECPEHSPLPCTNPLYECKYNNFEATQKHGCSQYESIGCEDNICEIQTLNPGETFGSKGTWVYRNLINIIIIILMLALIINHIVYIMRRKKK